MRPTQLLRTALVGLICALAAAQGAPRRGPPRGPIKEDKSTFFGKEGEQAQKGGTDLKQVALVGGALLLVGLGLLQIFGTMVTVKARDEKKGQCVAPLPRGRQGASRGAARRRQTRSRRTPPTTTR